MQYITGKLIPLMPLTGKEERSQITDLSVHLKPTKGEKMKFKESIKMK